MIIDHLMTPYRLERPVLTGSGIPGDFRSHAVDCPTVFRHNGRFRMIFIGFDGIGYQTAITASDDLVHWDEPKVILCRGSDREWDKVGMSGNSILMDNDLYGSAELIRHDGKYWMTYHSYPEVGYEAGPAEIGLAWTEDEDLLDWHCLEKPVFSWRDGAAWECGGLYKSFLMRHDGKFWLFYNAKNQADKGKPWTEQTGCAVSDDLLHWTRLPDNPVLPVDCASWDSRFASDPVIRWDSRQKQWVMFYFGLGNLSACEGLAVSSDLMHWEKFPVPILTTGTGNAIDTRYAHKPSVIVHDGVLYHFYCACRPWMEGDPAGRETKEFRTITVARSIPWENE